MSFAIAQFAFSIIAKSQAMLGDSLAMIVDALTYLFNWFAERKKEKYAEHLKGDNTEKAELLYRKYTYQLEIFPPFLTVSTLVVLNSIILKGAIHVLVLDTQRDATLQDKPNVDLMLLFSALNFLLDGLNIFCFAREKHGLGYKSTGHDETMQSLMTHDVTTERESIEENDQNKISETSERMQSLEIDCTVPEDEEKRGSSRVICCKQHSDENSNLNMCSAYTVSPSCYFYFVLTFSIGFASQFCFTLFSTLLQTP
jgi:Co/Zn/Cd efflux system component